MGDLHEQHPDYVVGFAYVPDIDLRNLSNYFIFNKYGMLCWPYVDMSGRRHALYSDPDPNILERP
mgnify:CR=1 FL=1